MTTTNKAKATTADYLRSIGVDPQDVPTTETVQSIAYVGEDPMEWQGETHARLRDEFEFYRAVQSDKGVSLREASKEGYIALPKGHDARMRDCHSEDEVIMIRRKDVGRKMRADAERRRKAFASRSVNDVGVELTSERRDFEVRYNESGV